MFNRIKIYTVHVKPDEQGSRFKPVFIKEGFNFPAFLFTIFWTLYQRLWAATIILVVVNVFFIALAKAHMFSHLSILALHLGVHLIVGFLGNDWIRARLNRKGYILSDITAADNYLRAQQRYLERYVTATA